MSHSIFGWDLPPGCRVSDIPGNRPEDERWEAIYENFWNKDRLISKSFGIQITKEKFEAMDKIWRSNSKVNRAFVELMDDYISAAIEYGMEVGVEEKLASREESKYYDRMAVEKAFEDAKDKDEALKKTLYYLGLSKEEPK